MAFPLYAGITPESEREEVMRQFVEEIAVRKPYLDTGSSGLPILLKFMVEHAERADLLFPCLARTAHPGYGYFFEQGETTWPEYWQIEGHSSRIHTCYTGIAGYFSRAIGGIRPDPSAWGMKRFVIKPQLVGELEWANTTSGSYYGEMVSNWKRTEEGATFDIEVPVNTTATVYIPAADLRDVRERGKPAAEAEGVVHIGRAGAREVFVVKSGAYQFNSASVPVPSTRTR
jgi:alpha-L-rhamnosidase